MDQHPTGTVTFLFTDIEGSTRLAREFPEVWENLRARHHQVLREAIESNHGFVFQIIGDAFCAAFHTAGDALKSALGAQQKLQHETWGDCVIRVRMGIHTGEAELHENEYQGYLTLSLVQRIMSAGHGGQILVSNVTENLLRGQLPKDVSLRDLGEHKFKDVPYPVRVFQVIAPDLQKEFPPLRVLDVAPNNLPTQLTSFIGREKEAADVKRLLANTHLLTLIGPGGTGKTRLSLQVASEVLHAYPHGVWLIELAPISDPSSVPAAALAALDLPAEVHRPAIDMLSDYLREKEALLVLDNCEHLVDACARMVDRLLHAAPKLRILASSREALGIAGEVSYRVPSLELPDIKTLPTVESLNQYEAVRLFIDRALAALPTFAVTNENAPAVAQICHRLDGIPLALELAAAKVRALSVEQIAKRLNDRFRLLTGGSRTALERHQTLRATLDWSYNLLPEKEQVLFRRLSIFVNGWTLEATEVVCSDEMIHSEDVFDLLEHLVTKSLVVAEEWQSDTRYRMLETMRQYANEKLVEAGESEKLRDRHLEYYLELAENAEPHLIRPEQLEWLDRLEADLENLRRALEWTLGKEAAEPSLRLCAALGMFWDLHCYWKEGFQWLERVLTELPKDQSPIEKIVRARALYYDACLAHQLDDVKRSRVSAEASLALCEETGERRDNAIARFFLALAIEREGDDKTANSLWERSLADFREIKDLYWEAKTQFYVHFDSIVYQRKTATLLFELAQKAGERTFLGSILLGESEREWRMGHLEEAERYLAEAEKFFEQVGYVVGSRFLMRGWMAHSRNDYSQARAMYMACVERQDLLGEKEMRAYAVQYLGILERDEGNLRAAEIHVKNALEGVRAFGRKSVTAWWLALLGQIHYLQGAFRLSKQNYRDSLLIDRGKELSSVRNQSTSSAQLVLISSLFAELAPNVAAQILSFLNTQERIQSELQMLPLLKKDFETALMQSQQRLNEIEFETAWSKGENMTLEEALDLALKTLDEI